MKKAFRAAVLLSIVSWACIAPRTLRDGTNIVTETYRLATTLFFAGQDPYVLPLIGGDRYEYSPFFCLLYGAFAFLPLKAQAASWAFFNALVFWFGITLWARLNSKPPWSTWLALIICSMELNISLLYQQSNSLLIGLTLIALAGFRNERYLTSGLILGIAINLKIYPVIFVMFLIFPFKTKFALGLAASALITTFSPALLLGLSADLELHSKWLRRLFEATNYRREDLDVASVFGRLGAPDVGRYLRYVIIGVLGALTCLGLRRQKDGEWIGAWIVLGVTGLLLVNPRSESPTFVILAPAYLLLSHLIFDRLKGNFRIASAILLYLSAFFITFVFTDAWPKSIWNPGSLRYGSKTIGALILWGMSVYWVIAGSQFKTLRTI